MGNNSSTPEHDEMASISPLERLDAALSNTSDVYVGAGEDEDAYIAKLVADIRSHVCEPFQVSAVVMPPGFPETPVGGTLTGICVARRDGYWLVYEPERDRFYCFWGTVQENLGAHGVFGSPLYCWSA